MFGDYNKDQVLLRQDEKDGTRVSVYIQQTNYENRSADEAIQVLDDLIRQAQEAKSKLGNA